MRSIPYVQLDVFTDTPLQGNQLGVFTDARGLSDVEMQSFARETNFSETTFILPRDVETEAREGVRVRIFTVAEELPFAGHPTLGTASWLHRQRNTPTVTLDLNVGKIPVSFGMRDGALFGRMQQKDPVFGDVHRAQDIAPMGGISPSEIRDDVPIQSVSTGLPFILVPVKSLRTMRALQFNNLVAAPYLARADATSIYWFCLETESDQAQVHSRMIFYGGEDPATGSASGGCISYLVKYGLVPSGNDVVLEQGIAMKRPSRVWAQAVLQGDQVTGVQVAGHVVEVARGSYMLP